MTIWSRIQAYMELARPFTLLAPALGMISGGVVGWGAESRAAGAAFPWLNIVYGALLAMMLNAGSNAFNQVFDLDVDSVNRPERPLPSGSLTRRGASLFAAVMYVLALFLAWLVNYQCLAIVAAGAAFTMIYSVPPIRTKRYWPLANFTIAVPRGVLLVAAGWSTAADVRNVEPWYISMVFGGFLLGAASTKDFADVEGDSAGGCRTLPLIYGPRKAALLISPFLILPFMLFPAGVRAGLLTGHPGLLNALGLLLACWGAYVAYIMLRSPDKLTSARNHPSWIHMYMMMTTAQVGLIAGYVI